MAGTHFTGYHCGSVCSVGVGHGTPPVLEGLFEALPCLVSGRSVILRPQNERKSALTRSIRRPVNRIKYLKVDAETGDEVEFNDIIKGYEVGKGQYIELDPDELEAIAIESKRIIDIDEFVPRNEIDDLYFNNPYYIIPDGEVGRQAFAVIREAIKKEGMVAIGTVMFTSREHIIALEARGRGLLGVTLRYPYELRNEAEYFDEIPDEKVPKDMLELATHIVETKAAHFEPEKFQDHYENALMELLKKKQAGQKVERAPGREPPRESSTLWMPCAAARKPRRGRPSASKGGPEAHSGAN